MKKIILSAAIFSSFVMCKKGETSSTLSYSDADSTAVSITSDTAIAKIETPEIGEIKDSIFSKNEMNTEQNQNKKWRKKIPDELDSSSLSNKQEKSEVMTKNKDSIQKNNEKHIHINITPKIIKETKIVYQNRPKKAIEEQKIVDRMQKNGTLQISVENLDQSESLAKEEIRKYDGIIKSENITGNQLQKNIYYQVKVPIQKFEYLIAELSELGVVENKELTTNGENYVEGTLCNLDIILSNNASEKAAVIGKAENFGGRSLSAISSGWNVIKEIFLFLLPFWPLYLILGFLYYYFKNKKNKKIEISENE